MRGPRRGGARVFFTWFGPQESHSHGRRDDEISWEKGYLEGLWHDAQNCLSLYNPTYQEPNRATDNAACAIAMVLMRELTPYASFEQSVLGTTIDDYLRDQPTDDDLIFNRAARLEVSGILTENPDNTVEGCVKEKLIG